MTKCAARELIEINGVDGDKLVDALSRVAQFELANYYYYGVLRQMLVGVEGDALRAIVDEARREDYNHFESLLPRIYELGGRLPNLAEIELESPLALNKLPRDASNVYEILEVLRNAADYHVREYTKICNMTCGRDNRTYGLALSILHEEIEHQVWFLEFIGHGLGERFAAEGRQGMRLSERFHQSQAVGSTASGLSAA